MENDEYEESSPSNAKYEDIIPADEEDVLEAVSDDELADIVLEDDIEPEEASPAEAEYEEEFFAEVKVGNVIITAKASAGVVPEGTVLWAEKVVDAEVKEAIDEVVEEKRNDEAQVIESLKFDIKLLNNGEEIAPDGPVSISFAIADAATNADVNIYHIKEDKDTEELVEAEVLEVETNEEDEEIKEITDEEKTPLVVETVTESFSYYVVEFTVGEYQYVLNGDESVKLSEILTELNISGTVTDAEVSDDTLFKVDKDTEGDDWTVTALKAFSTKEWMKVTIGGKLYEITVTDDHEHDGSNFVEWSSANSLPNYGTFVYLTNDVDLTNTWNVPEGSTHLCLNGHVIKMTGDGSVITVPSGAALYLYDCDTTTTHQGYIDDATGLWHLESGSGSGTSKTITGGIITGGKGTPGTDSEGTSGGGVCVYGTLEMHGGTIAGNSVTSIEPQSYGAVTNGFGAGVYVGSSSEEATGGTFNMTGGTISGNARIGYIGSGEGGGVNVLNGGSFTMSGTAKICENTTWCGGGVEVGDDACFTMTGGEISGNTASGNYAAAGGVEVAGDEQTIFTMTGGTITGNKVIGTDAYAGGVEGYIGTLKLGGTAQITDNKAYDNAASDGIDCNLYLNDTITVTLGTGGSGDIAKPTTGFDVGVTTAIAPEDSTPVKITTNGVSTDIGYFTSDNDVYEVKFNTDHLELAVKTTPAHAHSFTYTADGGKLTAACTEGCDKSYDTNPLTLTLTAPASLVYDGNAKVFNFASGETDAWTGAGLELPTITYYQKLSGQEQYTLLEEAPKDIGDYMAEIKVDTISAQFEFTITKSAPATLTLTTDKYTYVLGEIMKLTAEIDVTDGTEVYFEFDGGTRRSLTVDGVARCEIPLSKPGEYIVKASAGDSSDQITITVIEKQQTFTVTFIYRNGTENIIKTVKYNETVTKPQNPDMTGYTFVCWCSDAECKISYDFSKQVKNNLSLYAKWTKIDETEGKVRTENRPVEVEVDVQQAKPEEEKLLEELKKNTGASVVSSNSLADAVKDKVKEDVTKTGKDVILFIDTKLTGIKVEKSRTGAAEKATTTLTYDATPWMSTVGTDGKVEETQLISNSDLNGNIKLRLPVPKSITEKYVNIVHSSEGYEKKTYKNLVIQKQGTDQAYVEIQISHFSTFELTFSNEKSVDPVPQRSNSGSTSTLFTGTWGHPVTNGTWRYDPETDKWSYTTTFKFTDTWGYIANPYAGNEAAWFYFDKNGNMLTGWQLLFWKGSKKWYYFNPVKDSRRGKCQLGGVTPDGWTVDESGAWIESIPRK